MVNAPSISGTLGLGGGPANIFEDTIKNRSESKNCFIKYPKYTCETTHARSKVNAYPTTA